MPFEPEGGKPPKHPKITLRSKRDQGYIFEKEEFKDEL